ncbi:MAG TPA: class I adenylate-forming enzyme family protein, partial [Thermoanaerobaculia bacterium]|nr:class I adenylate-forming enzyme family protein [Thermoanaerobaculia bacterium]
MIPGDLLGERARLTPDKTALVYVPTGERLTYAELDARAVACARVWRQVLNLSKGARFAILADNRIGYLDAFFAAPKAGITLVPLGTRLTPKELAGILEDARPAGLLYGAEHAESVKTVQELVSLDHWVALDEPVEPGDATLRDLAARLPSDPWERERCDPEDLWCLLYTSGTTGRPKGVMIPHRMVVWNGYNTVIGWQL